MIYRFLLLLPMLHAVSVNLSAQVVTKGCTHAAMKTFQASTTYVVETDDQAFNQWMRETMPKVWKANPFEFVNAVRLDTLVKSDKNVFLFAQAKDDRGAAFHLLNSQDVAANKDYAVVLSLGGVKQTKYLFTPALTGPKIIGSFKYSPKRAQVTAGLLENEIMLAFLSQSIQAILGERIKTEVKDSVKFFFWKNSPLLKEKTLLVNSNYNDGTIAHEDKPLISDKALGEYPFPYELVTTDVVLSRIENDPSSMCYMFLYFASSYVSDAEDSGDLLIYDPSTHQIVFFEDNWYGPWIDKGEMKDIVYATKGKI